MKTTLFLLTLAALPVSAKADFIGLPIQCSAYASGEKDEIQVAIGQTGREILGVLTDGNDQANVVCHRVPAKIGDGYHFLDCKGTWSDGSVATLSTPLYTYVPMTQIQRSETGHRGEIQKGICGRK